MACFGLCQDSISLRWKGAGFYWTIDSAGAVEINEERQGEISLGRS